jgi:hypothetical protein
MRRLDRWFKRLTFWRQFLFTLIIIVCVSSIAVYQKIYADSIDWEQEQPLAVTAFYIGAKPTPMPTPNPLIAKNEELTAEVLYISAENVRMNEYILSSRGGDRKPKEVLNYSKLSAQRYIVELIERMSAAHGLDSGAYVYSIVAYESKFDTTCHNTKGEDSRGLLQVNVADKAHAKRNPNKTKLFDPAYNLDYQLDELSLYYHMGKQRGLKGADLAIFMSKEGQRPKWGEWIAAEIRKYFAEYKKAVVKEV